MHINMFFSFTYMYLLNSMSGEWYKVEDNKELGMRQAFMIAEYTL